MAIRFLHSLYAQAASLYKIFRLIPLICNLSKQTCMGVVMDIVYIGAIVAFLLVTCAFAAGCAKLGERQ
jgi:hypothetical protein